MTDTKRAAQVCLTCKIRKKACDKALPACSFCQKRKLVCRYDIVPPKLLSYSDTWNETGRSHGVVPLSPSSDAYPRDETRPLLTPPASHASPHSRHSAAEASLFIDELLHQQVSSVIELANLTLDDIIERYFQTFHEWLPIIAPQLLRQAASKYGAGVPPADFSVLILAMCLVMIPPEIGAVRSLVTREFLYTTTKALFMQTQAVVCTSVPLIQAGLIITACEYTCARPEAAYISLGTCTSMARVLGITHQDGVQGDVSTTLQDLEKSNLSWVIVMLERFILCEINQKQLRPLTEYPNGESRLPSDLPPTHPTAVGHTQIEDSKLVTLSTLLATNISRFGRQAQAVSFLDQLLSTRRSTANHQSILSELRHLDSKIQAFLAIVINEDKGAERITCVAIAISLRSLFLLHGTILEHVEIYQSEADNDIRQSSSAACGTACTMVLDVARFHTMHLAQGEVQTMPICCYYVNRSAMKYLQERDKKSDTEDLSHDLEFLQATEKQFIRRWILWET